jgi:hypothetical protein
VATTDEPNPADAIKGATDAASDALKRFSTTAETLRARTDLAGKTLAAGGSALVTAVGIAKFSDIWPFPGGPGSWVAVIVVVVGFLTMGFSVLLFAKRFWDLNQPIVFRSELSLMPHLSTSERTDLVEPLYGEVAALNGARSLAAFEARAHRMERVARWLPSPEAAIARAEAVLIQTEVLAIVTQAKVRVLRQRINAAVTDSGARNLAIAFAIGVIAFGWGADFLASERTDKVAVAKACADARAVDEIVEDTLPDICGEPPDATSPAPATVSDRLAAANASLATALAECRKAARVDSSCEPIEAAMRTLVP